MLVTTIFSVVTLMATATATALPNGNTIIDAISTIRSDATQLQKTIEGWAGDQAGFQNINAQAINLIGDIKIGSGRASKSKSMGCLEANGLGSATSDLEHDVNSMLTHLARMKPKCDNLKATAHIDATYIVLVSLQEQLKATDDFNIKLLDKVKCDVETVAIKQHMKEISSTYRWAIKGYERK